MALTCLLDNSVITRLSVDGVRARVGQLVVDFDRVARASISDLEVGFSARDAAAFDTIIGALDPFELVEIEPRHFRRALQVQRLLADRGLRGRKVPDLLIAAAAESQTMTVVHYDADFDHISTITGQPASWVVPPGTIDGHQTPAASTTPSTSMPICLNAGRQCLVRRAPPGCIAADESRVRERCEQRLGAWSGDGRAEFIEQFAGPLPLLVNVDPLELDPGRPDDYTTLATRPRPWAATSAPSALLSGRLAENIRLSLQF